MTYAWYRLLPHLSWFLFWKVMWVLGWGLPLWFTQQLRPDSQETLISTLMGVVLVPLVMPWGYVVNQYVKAPGDAWRKPRTASTPPQPASSPAPATTRSRL